MSNNVGVLFSGQGSQTKGMGRDLADADAEIMDLWKKAEKISGHPLRGIYWDGGQNMDDTRTLQPALTVVCVSIWMALSRKLKAAAFAGHSLGEYSALAAASVINIDRVIELVTLRGELMADADPDGKGAMAAIVKLDLAGAQALVDEVNAVCPAEPDYQLRLANYNTPAQYVASGSRAAVETLLEKARDKKARAIQLAVSGAFHSPFMAAAAAEMTKAINKADFSNARVPVYSNVTGKAAQDGAEIKNLLIRQMTSAVLWTDTIRNQYANGVDCFVECGPKNVLAKMVEQNLSGVAEEGSYRALVASTVQDLENLTA